MQQFKGVKMKATETTEYEKCVLCLVEYKNKSMK